MLKRLLMSVIAISISTAVYAEINFDKGKSFSLKDEMAKNEISSAISQDKKTKLSKEWTIMVYVNAKNDLEKFGMKDINEMEMIGSSDKINVVVELGRMDGFDSSEGDWTGSKRYLIRKDGNTGAITSPVLADLGKVDMGDWKHLVDFGKWAKAKYPAKKYMLIVWNHGSGWKKSSKSLVDKGLSYDFETNNHFTTP
ncbi:MAG: clostripain-related cysteine peptidase, partial [Elusimicrobia bacterium]|nr:clostripain-related cysteine peptidase [Elusimicrobiota bacterium]